MDKAPACSQEYSPHSGGSEASSFESEGGPGEKMETPGAMTGGATDDPGGDQVAKHAAFNASRGRPAPSATPDNAEGSLETSNPTAAEGAGTAY